MHQTQETLLNMLRQNLDRSDLQKNTIRDIYLGIRAIQNLYEKDEEFHKQIKELEEKAYKRCSTLDVLLYTKARKVIFSCAAVAASTLLYCGHTIIESHVKAHLPDRLATIERILKE